MFEVQCDDLCQCEGANVAFRSEHITGKRPTASFGLREEEGRGGKEEREKGDERRKKDTVYVSTEYMLLMNALQHTHNRVNMMPPPPRLLFSPAQ